MISGKSWIRNFMFDRSRKQRRGHWVGVSEAVQFEAYDWNWKISDALTNVMITEYKKSWQFVLSVAMTSILYQMWPSNKRCKGQSSNKTIEGEDVEKIRLWEGANQFFWPCLMSNSRWTLTLCPSLLRS
jgi:hypothetical protein